MMRSFSIAALVVSSLWALPGHVDGQEVPPIISEDWACGTKIEPTPLATAFFRPTYVFENPADDDGLPTVLAGAVQDGAGSKFSMLFARTADGWSGYPGGQQEGFWNAYFSYDGTRAVLFSMLDVGGPGHSYTVLATADGFKTVTCGEVPAPDTELDTTDFMLISSVDLDEKGNGLLRGIVSYGGDKPAECFTATSSDGGANWTQPKRAEACSDSVVSELAPVDEDDGPLAELKAFASF